MNSLSFYWLCGEMPMRVVVGAAVCGGWGCRLAGAAGAWGPGCWRVGRAHCRGICLEPLINANGAN